MRKYLKKIQKQYVDQMCLDCLQDQIKNDSAFWWDPYDTKAAIANCNEKECNYYSLRCDYNHKLSIEIKK